MDVITVKQLNTYIKSLIESDAILYNVTVKGEISNFTNHYKTGHFYFSLKYDNALIKAVMFRSSASKIKFVPKDGMLVVARGRVSVFERDGQYQLYVEEMSPEGEGDLNLAFEMLKEKLRAEGLFELSRKKPLPKIPLKIGVVTSPTGAAVRDIINVLGRRFPAAKVILYPVLVQGEMAADSICNALKYFDETKSVDVIIAGRGGGSIEDLWAFNEEKVARTICAMHIPVISAVGHETDFTIADFAADLRAPTPSAAAELAVPETGELITKFNNVTNRLKTLLESNLKQKTMRMSYINENPVFKDPMRLINDRQLLLGHTVMNMESAMKLTTANARNSFMALAAKLDSLSPLAVLSRGYAVTKTDGKIIKSASQLKAGQKVYADYADGSVGMTVDDVKLRENKNG